MRHSHPYHSAARGFTLIEVLVALTVLAIALGALVKGGADTASSMAYLRDKTFGHWVAMNRIAELQLQSEWPRPGTTRGEAEMAGREWYWSAVVSETDDPNVRKLEVSVRVEEDRHASPVERLIAFLPRPPERQPQQENH